MAGYCPVCLPALAFTTLTSSDKGYEEAAKIKLADTETYAYPIIAGHRIFMKDNCSCRVTSFLAGRPVP